MGPVTFTATSGTNYASYTQFSNARAGGAGDVQCAKIAAWVEGASLANDTIEVQLVLYDTKDPTSPVKEVITLTIADDDNDRRTGPAGNNGYWLCKVTPDKGSDNKVDLLGAGGSREWRIGMNGAFPGSQTALHIQAFPANVV